MDRIDPYTTMQPSKYKDGDTVMQATYDPQVLAMLGEISATLKGIKARLDGGIKTQAGIISVNL